MQQSRPSLAETARTLANGHLSAAIRVPWTPQPEYVAHRADEQGDITVFLNPSHPAVRTALSQPDVSAVIAIHDISPTPGPNRVRGLLELGGLLRPLPMAEAARIVHPPATHPGTGDFAMHDPAWAFRLSVERISLTQGPQVTLLSQAEYAAADPDPIQPDADRLLAHLTRTHPEFLCAIAGTQTARGVVPVNLDRYGISFTVNGRLQRAAFPFSCDSRSQLPHALRALLKSARPPVRAHLSVD